MHTLWRNSALGLLAASAGLVAQSEKPASHPSGTAASQPAASTLADEYAALLKRADAAGYGPEVVKQFQPEFASFAKLHAGTEEALSARLWMFQQCWWSREQGGQQEAKKMAEQIFAEHKESKQLAKIAEFDYVFAPGDKSEVLEQLLALTPRQEVKAAVLLALAVSEKRAKEPAVRQRANERLARLLEEYGGLAYKQTTYGEMANAHLNPIKAADLRVGKTAPEITGKDLDGKAMKLSDQRGKVVVLDFWGFW